MFRPQQFKELFTDNKQQHRNTYAAPIKPHDQQRNT
jgi:hypothetical protein